MGLDKHGVERGACADCNCSEYEAPRPGYGCRCDYCDCVPTRHLVKGTSGGNAAQPTSCSPLAASGTPSRQDIPDPVSFFDAPVTNAMPPASNHAPTATCMPLDDLEPKSDAKSEAKSDEPKKALTFDEMLKQRVPNRTKARENARRGAPPRRQNRTERTPTPESAAGGRPRQRKSVATKVHNLDEVMGSTLSDPGTARKIDKMFKEFDDDASNELDQEECKQLTGYILEQCGLQPGIIPDFVYDEAFAKYDEDGGGTITLEEFREFLMSHIKHQK